VSAIDEPALIRILELSDGDMQGRILDISVHPLEHLLIGRPSPGDEATKPFRAARVITP